MKCDCCCCHLHVVILFWGAKEAEERLNAGMGIVDHKRSWWRNAERLVVLISRLQRRKIITSVQPDLADEMVVGHANETKDRTWQRECALHSTHLQTVESQRFLLIFFAV